MSEEWRVNKHTPSTIITPHGGISVSWDSNDDRGKTRTRAEETAARIAACVNACEGIPTEALETGVITDLLDACQQAMETLVVFSYTRKWDQDKYEDAVDDFVDALNKAKGESP